MHYSKYTRRLIFTLIGALTLGCGAQSEPDALPYYLTADLTPQWIDRNDPAFDTLHTIAPFAFIDQNGDTVAHQTVAGKIYAANFFFTTCSGICLDLTRNFALIQEEFRDADDVQLLSHTVAPEIDSIPQLKAYAEAHGALSGKWHFVTGDRSAIYEAARASYFADADLGFRDEEAGFLHTENVFLVDRQQRIRGVYNGTLAYDIERLIADIEILQNEG